MTAKGRISMTGTLGTDVNYIKEFKIPEGRKIRMVTDRLIRFGEAWGDNKKSMATRDVTLKALFRVAGDAALPPGRAFGAVYLAFLGRPNGPRAGWLLASLDAPFVIARLREAAGWHDHAGETAASGEEAGT